MVEHLEEAVKDLVAKQVGFYVFHDNASGQTTLHLTSTDLIRYSADPVGYLSEHYGVSREDYLGWHRSGYKVICSGLTKSGKPCKATVPGLSIVHSPAEWVQGRGGRCTVHS